PPPWKPPEGRKPPPPTRPVLRPRWNALAGVAKLEVSKTPRTKVPNRFIVVFSVSGPGRSVRSLSYNQSESVFPENLADSRAEAPGKGQDNPGRVLRETEPLPCHLARATADEFWPPVDACDFCKLLDPQGRGRGRHSPRPHRSSGFKSLQTTQSSGPKPATP